MNTGTLRIIEGIYRLLKRLEVVRSTDDFSVIWLGMEKSYLRCLRARNREPTARVFATFTERLLCFGEILRADHHPIKIRNIGEQLLVVAWLCVVGSAESEV